MHSFKRLLRELRNIWRVADRHTFLLYFTKVIISLPEMMRTRTMLSADKRMRGRVCQFRVSKDKTVVLDGAHFGSAREIYARRVYFTIPGFDIDEGQCIVDLGANIGAFTTLAAVCGKKVVAVEAQPHFIPVMQANLARNHCAEKVSIECGLIGANSGLLSSRSNWERASICDAEPLVLSLDEIVTRHSLREIDFLKIDIEGSEFGLFGSDVSWLSRVKRIAMEVHLEFGDVARLIGCLEGAGFQTWLVDSDGRIASSLGGVGGYLFARRA